MSTPDSQLKASAQALMRRGLSTSQVAKICRISRTTAWRWKRDTERIPEAPASALERIRGDADFADLLARPTPDIRTRAGLEEACVRLFIVAYPFAYAGSEDDQKICDSMLTALDKIGMGR